MELIMKTDRLVAVIMTLLERDSVCAAELAERFEVSLRTVYRDIDTLSRAGVPVTTSPGPGGACKGNRRAGARTTCPRYAACPTTTLVGPR